MGSDDVNRRIYPGLYETLFIARFAHPAGWTIEETSE